MRYRSRRGLTLWEVLATGAGMGLVAFLGALAFSHRPRETDHRRKCTSNARMLAMAIRMYVEDFDERLPPAEYAIRGQLHTIPSLLHPYLQDFDVWRCRETPGEEDQIYRFDGSPGDMTVNYGYNWLALAPHGVGVRTDQVRNPDETVLFAETNSYRVVPTRLAVAFPGSVPEYRHLNGCTVAWLNGRARYVPAGVLEHTAAWEGQQYLGTGIDAYDHWNRK